MMPISEVHLIDCMEFMRTLPDKFFDLAIVDPPYGIGKDGQIKTTGGNGGRKAHAFKNWDNSIPSKKYFTELIRVSKHQIIWGANYFTQNIPGSMGWIVWDKGQRINQSDGELAFSSFDRALRIITMNRVQLLIDGTIHPTQKPVALYKWLLTNYAKPGQKIFDSHMGSQSSRIAAYQLGFDYWGCELDPDYYRDGCKRFDAVIHKKDTTEYIPIEPTNTGQSKLF